MRTQLVPELETISEEWERITLEEIRSQPLGRARAIFRNWTSFNRQRGYRLARNGDRHE